MWDFARLELFGAKNGHFATTFLLFSLFVLRAGTRATTKHYWYSKSWDNLDAFCTLSRYQNSKTRFPGFLGRSGNKSGVWRTNSKELSQIWCSNIDFASKITFWPNSGSRSFDYQIIFRNWTNTIQRVFLHIIGIVKWILGTLGWNIDLDVRFWKISQIP